MTRLLTALKRDLDVAFSPGGQPAWFRVTKWIVFLAVVVRFHRAAYFWPCLGWIFAAGTVLHFFYRWKTRGWTQPWGGWNDPKFTQG